MSAPSASVHHPEHNAAERATADFVADHPWVTVVGRIGWLTKGFVYTVAGLLAVFVALDAFGWDRDEAAERGEASPTGVFRTVAAHALGGPLLVALSGGLVVYAGWRLVAAAMPGRNNLKVLVTRIGYVVSAVMYSSFAYTALRLVSTPPQQTNGNSTVSDLTRHIMRHVGGRLVIAAAGIVLAGAAVYRIHLGWTQDVTREMNVGGWSRRRLDWTERLGSAGEIGRGLALGLIGFFLVRAAVTYDADEATGLDGALRRASDHLWTKIAVPIVALGFVCYGVFCLATFTRRRFEPPR